MPAFVYFEIWTGDGSERALDAASLDAATQIAKNSSALSTAIGQITHVGDGLYCYEFDETEVDTPGFVAFVFSRAGYRPQLAWTSVEAIWSPGETDTTLLRFPFAIVNDDGELAEGAVASGAELQTSRHGAAFANAGGSLTEIDYGFYFYEGVAADAADEGPLAVKFEKAGFRTTFATFDVAASGGAGDPPAISIVSPTPGVAPGDPGGFPADFESAIHTPIVIEVSAAGGLALVVVVVRFKDETQIERCIYRRGAFRRGFAAASFEEIDGDILRLHVIPDSSWPASTANVLDDVSFDVDAVGGDTSALSDIGASS